MKEKVIANTLKLQRLGLMLKIFEFCLPILAVFLACYMSFRSEIPIPIKKPVVLIIASFFILIPLKSKPLRILQKIVAFYLVCVPVNELALQHFQANFFLFDINISYSAIVLSLCVLGYLLGKANSTNVLRDTEVINIVQGWILALVIVIVHMVLLSLILKRFYGYGYERNLNVLGNLCLYFLLFTVLREKLSSTYFRQVIVLVPTAFYTLVFFTNR